jgi:PAS domain S-box-containing protein
MKLMVPWCLAVTITTLIALVLLHENLTKSVFLFTGLTSMNMVLAGWMTRLIRRYVGMPLAALDAGLQQRLAGRETVLAMAYPDEIGRVVQRLNELLRKMSDKTKKMQEIGAVLAAREGDLSDLVDHAIVGMQRLDKSGCVTWANRRLLDALGYAADDYLGRAFHEFFVDTEESNAVGRLLRKGLRVVDRGLVLRAKDGKVRFFQLDATPVSDGTRFRYTRCFLRDVTESRRAQLELERSLVEVAQTRSMIEEQAAQLQVRNTELDDARKRAEAATESKSRFLANVSHELRTPMTAILGFSETLLDEADHLPTEQRSALETIRRNGKYLLDLINDILDFSKIEAGKMVVESVTCSLPHLVDDTIDLIRPRAQAKGLSIAVEYVGVVPATIETDSTRLRQVLLNLLSNAVKFTERGSILLRVQLVPHERAAPLRFEVIDTGIGMTAEQLPKLFQPFTQADASTTRKFGGTGLGLSISRRLAQILGGDIRVESVAGRGTTFSMNIAVGAIDHVPLIQPQGARGLPRESEKSPAVVERFEHRVLLAEDGPDNQRLISHLLRRAGATVVIADNGRAALETALAEQQAGTPFDVILMDMQMPVMDGYTAVRRLRAQGYELPIIALTANAMAGDRERCLAAGCDDYDVKPIDRNRLFQTLRKHLPQPVA